MINKKKKRRKEINCCPLRFSMGNPTWKMIQSVNDMIPILHKGVVIIMGSMDGRSSAILSQGNNEFECSVTLMCILMEVSYWCRVFFTFLTNVFHLLFALSIVYSSFAFERFPWNGLWLWNQYSIQIVSIKYRYSTKAFTNRVKARYSVIICIAVLTCHAIAEM